MSSAISSDVLRRLPRSAVPFIVHFGPIQFVIQIICENLHLLQLRLSSSQRHMGAGELQRILLSPRPHQNHRDPESRLKPKVSVCTPNDQPSVYMLYRNNQLKSSVGKPPRTLTRNTRYWTDIRVCYCQCVILECLAIIKYKISKKIILDIILVHDHYNSVERF